MAIAGGVTVAYQCNLDGDGLLVVASMSMLRSLCVTPEKAVERIRQGERVVVAGSDMVDLRQRLGQAATG